ncbi:MAG: DNA/RNA nuclease SfsA [Clostridiales bacterium]|nr:DNA/RNA nuclease SfsA [Clostridiales bacterium]
MKYSDTVKGTFISRPNRFIAYAFLDGEECVCHVKNTGRCNEILTKGAKIIAQRNKDPKRKTKYDLISVYKGERLINIDSQAPNKVFFEWISSGGFFKDVTYVKPEYTFGSSRFDFYVEAEGRKILIEVKGVTLEVNDVAMFPDAPTERGNKHVRELIEAKKNGYDAYVFFVVKMEGCKYFTPNVQTHPELYESLKRAKESGVGVFAVYCSVGEDSLEIKGLTNVVL